MIDLLRHVIDVYPTGSFFFGCAILATIERVTYYLTHINSPIQVVQCTRAHTDDEADDDEDENE